MKIAIVGGPSTGKTTIIEGEGRQKGLVERLKRRGYKVEVVEDVARYYIEKWIHNKREMVIEDQHWILHEWLDEEKKAEDQDFDFIICDGASFLAYNYCFLFKCSDRPSFQEKLFKTVMANLSSYDYIFFIPMEFSPKEDGLRRWLNEAVSISLSIRTFLSTYLQQDPRWHIIKGTPKKRVDKILEIILKPC